MHGTGIHRVPSLCPQQFLQRALMPLHKPKCVAMYHQQLSYCVTQVRCKLIATSQLWGQWGQWVPA